jgi:DNA-binding MarR family transcriptional regulator
MTTAGEITEEAPAISKDPHPDVISDLAANAKAIFEGQSRAPLEPLQNLLDCLTARVVGVTFEAFREEFDTVVRLLRSAFGQMARFAKGDFREQASFYLGQLHALTEVAYRSGHQRVPREALELVARSEVAKNILAMIVQARTIGAGVLARQLNMKESNLSAVCKPLVKRELLRRDKFGKRVRYSPTPLTFAVVRELGQEITERKKQASEALQEARSLPRLEKGSRDWPQIAAASAAASLKPGSNVMANTNDFVSPVLTLAAVRGARRIAIDSSGRQVRLESTEKTGPSKLNLPESVGKSLSEQVKACYDNGFITGIGAVDWKGDKIMIVNEPSEPGLKVEFVKHPDPRNSKTKARVAFQEIQDEKRRIIDFERIYVREVLETCKWEKLEAADILGIKPPKLNSLIKSLNISNKMPD